MRPKFVKISFSSSRFALRENAKKRKEKEEKLIFTNFERMRQNYW
jgi:hypothetical protein